MDELEKLKAAKEVRVKWERSDPPISYHDWIDAEIARIEDPHAEAKDILGGWKKYGSVDKGQKIIAYVDHLLNELAHYKIQYQHAKEAAAEPLEPKRVLATAAKILQDGGKLRHEDAKPYEVKK
jgi:hypothetical protein